MDNGDIVVIQSVWEDAFGRIMAEAMARAGPVVASDMGAIPELIDDRNHVGVVREM